MTGQESLAQQEDGSALQGFQLVSVTLMFNLVSVPRGVVQDGDPQFKPQHEDRHGFCTLFIFPVFSFLRPLIIIIVNELLILEKTVSQVWWLPNEVLGPGFLF